MALQIKAISDAIAGLTVTGLTFYPLAQLNRWELTGPTFFPDPQDYVTNFVYAVDSFGSSASAKAHVEYDLTWTFAYAKVGKDYGMWAIYDPMVTLFGQMMDVLLVTDVAGALNGIPPRISAFGPIMIPNSVLWHGCKVTFHIFEFVN